MVKSMVVIFFAGRTLEVPLHAAHDEVMRTYQVLMRELPQKRPPLLAGPLRNTTLHCRSKLRSTQRR